MEIESWWLLAVPLFFGLGWFAARIDLRSGARPRGHLPEAYFRGLNFLLNEQPDKAIDAFIDVVRLDPETVELHFALGNLFRRRGETDRAIRVHLNLAERRDLDAQQREHALFELGQDYLKAGLLDRAEDAFNRLEGSRYAAAALHHRLEIAQMVRDWPLAIAHAERLQRDSGERHGREIAHFRCELAAAAMSLGTPQGRETARREIAAAAEAEPGHPRPALLAGELARAEDDPAGAIAAWGRLSRENPAYLTLVAGQWLAAHADTGRAEAGIDALERVHREHPSADTLSAIAEGLVPVRGQEAALAWAKAELQRQPSLLGFERLLALHAPLATDERRAEIEFTQRLIQPQARRLARYVCRHCGFKARQFYWQCPGCSRWDTYAPKRTEEIERG
ncbi:MAG TPA: lipopolysaccharide assembly protein LapB [Quisquiliibacterium sp.]|nr:lipopolysaccharide assembly protein LapB [Quisquiliibacterium sp.]